jgi:predicted phosphodiesterase
MDLLKWLAEKRIEQSEAKELLKQLQRRKDLEYSVFKHDFSGQRIRVGILGDTHFGNKWTDKKFLNDIFKSFKKESVEAIYHTGDLTDGPWQRHQNILEQYAHGIENQVNDFIKDFPSINGVTTYIIDGNHDGWYRKMGAGSPGKQISEKRSDIKYLGGDEALIKIGKIELMLSHPDDGNAYAYSYKAQRQIESMFKMEEEIPRLIAQGHYHKIFFMNFGGTNYFCTGTTCRQTPWMRGKKIAADMGAFILDIYRDQSGNLTKLTSTLLPYHGDKHSQAIK